MSRVNFILIILVHLGIVANAQSRLEVIGRADDNRILLRWAPSDAVSWQYGIKYGYTVERYTISRDSTLVRPPVKIKLNPQTIVPEPLAHWKSLVDDNDYAAVAAQAIYGETFELTENYRNDISQIVNKTREQEQRFSFALFASDQSFEVATLSGLALVDNNAKENEKYMYKILSNVPDSLRPIDEATLFIGIIDKRPLPKPQDFTGAFGNRTVMLKWNRTFFEREYVSYIIERSDDGGNSFKAINKTPLVNTFEGENPAAKNYYKLDSLPQNNKEYHYRVRGVSSFGEFGPYSDTLKGKGFEEIQAQAAITAHRVIDNKQVAISWEFPEEKESIITGFVIQKSAKPNGPYRATHIDTLGVDTRNFTDDEPMSTNYYRVGFMNGRQFKFSYPYLVQLEDSIPPSPPIGISYTIDTTGVVNISWSENSESDLLGYRVYRSNFKSAEFIQITNKAIDINQYSDTLTLNTLTKDIYYLITAVDTRFNNSDYSELLEVKKPDIVPPVPAVFKNYLIKDDTLYLEWVKSSSEDVSHYLLYKNDYQSSEWELLSKENSNADKYKEVITLGGDYRYEIVTVDLVGNESNSDKPLLINLPTKNQGDIFVSFKAKWSNDKSFIKLEWETKKENSHYLIYKAFGEDQFTMLKSINKNQFIDYGVRTDESYRYMIVIAENDEYSKIIKL